MNKHLKNESRMEGGLSTRGECKKSTPEMPLISVITVVLNGEKHLEQTVLSVINQDYENIEYIIIDGGSTDRTLDIIKKYEDRIDYWISEPDNGIYDAMNKGIDLAKGDLVGLLNAGDFYEVDTLKTIADAYKSIRIPCIFYGNTYILQEDLGIRYKSYAHTKHWFGMGFSHPAMFVQKQIYNSIGKYALKYKLASDYEFLLRAVNENVLLVYVDKFLVNYRNSGLSATNLYTTLNEIRIINSNYFGIFNLNHLKYLVFYFKSITLIVLQKLIQMFFGDKLLLKMRYIYTKKIIAKNNECI